ncbi:MAG: YceI family protein, partial [Planctomycetota bacterium]
GGQALEVPEAQLEQGEIYHVTPGMGTQFVWHSDAPLMRVMAVCNRVVGYFVTPFDIAEGDTPLLAGTLRIPVAALRIGAEDLDNEFHGPQALNAAEYPEITLEMTGASDVKQVSVDGDRRQYTLNLTGQLQVKDATVAVTIPMRMTLVPFTWQTMQINMGDMLILRGSVEVPTADLGLGPQNPASRDFASETAELDIYLLCSTMSPERHLDPNIKTAEHVKQLRFMTLLRDFDDPTQAYEFGRAFMREYWDNGPALNRMAWAALTEEDVRARDLAFVAEVVTRANELTKSTDAATLHTLAKLHIEKGEWPTALSWARLAAEHLEGTPPYVAMPIRATLARCEQRAGQQ